MASTPPPSPISLRSRKYNSCSHSHQSPPSPPYSPPQPDLRSKLAPRSSGPSVQLSPSPSTPAVSDLSIPNSTSFCWPVEHEEKLPKLHPVRELLPRNYEQPIPTPLSNPLNIPIVPVFTNPIPKPKFLRGVIIFPGFSALEKQADPPKDLRKTRQGESNQRVGCLQCEVEGLKCSFQSSWQREDCCDEVIRTGIIPSRYTKVGERCCARCKRNGESSCIVRSRPWVVDCLESPWICPSLSAEELAEKIKELEGRKPDKMRFCPAPPATRLDKEGKKRLKTVLDGKKGIKKPFWWFDVIPTDEEKEVLGKYGCQNTPHLVSILMNAKVN
ncbi:hypothetical protein G7Y89_g9658 [Cudoniella acicularis]|uniref:Uncharacterized protein n=1 Tax=Cudoniella acicularis TaxID=354080 RepID=A0A8H4VZT5_9HELO|nr:hypothetical protein G7Y89_g9658 [Cudoniella acicularis]